MKAITINTSKKKFIVPKQSFLRSFEQKISILNRRTTPLLHGLRRFQPRRPRLSPHRDRSWRNKTRESVIHKTVLDCES